MIYLKGAILNYKLNYMKTKEPLKGVKVLLILLTLISLTSCFWNKESNLTDTDTETSDQESNYIDKDYTYKLLTE
jgi:hypothetical protein